MIVVAPGLMVMAIIYFMDIGLFLSTKIETSIRYSLLDNSLLEGL